MPGWLAITMTCRRRPGGAANVMQKVDIVRDNVLTIRRAFTVTLPDGSRGTIDCGNRHVT